MHFAFSDQQLEFRDAVRQVLAKECTTDDLRAAVDAPSARTPRWATLAELGVVGLTVPEAHGGFGLGLVDLVALVEEAGRVALPEPLVETTGLAAPLLAELAADGSDGEADPRVTGWLGGGAQGGVAAAVGDAGRPTAPIAGADGADLLLLVTDVSGRLELHGLDAGACPVTPVASLDPTRRLGAPPWEPSPATMLAYGPGVDAMVDRTADRAAVVVGAELLGLADAMITMTASYARDRQQFGKPIGSFQAVKHLVAGAQVLLEFARPVVYGAAWALDERAPDATRAASVAKAYASEAAL